MTDFAAVKQTGDKPRNIKSNNQKLVLTLLRQSGVMSLSEIAEMVKLSKTTVAKIVNTLVDKGYVVSVGKGSSTEEGGKRPELFTFNVTCAFTIALQNRHGNLRGVLMDLASHVLFENQCECSPDIGYEDYVSASAGLIKGLLAESNISPEKVCGIVLGCDGIVDPVRGILRFSIHRKWENNMPIAADLKSQLGLDIPVFVDNSCRFYGYAELEKKETYASGSSITIFTSYSTGGCILFKGQMLHGENGFMGEYGHIIVEPDSKIRCSCGGYGCFETVVSPEALINAAYEAYKEHPESSIYEKAQQGKLEYIDIFNAANQGDSFSCAQMDRIARYFAILIHNITLLHDPQNVIIEGVYTEAGDYFLSSIRRALNNMPFYKIKRNLNITFSTLDPENAFLSGASRYAADTYFDNEELYI